MVFLPAGNVGDGSKATGHPLMTSSPMDFPNPSFPRERLLGQRSLNFRNSFRNSSPGHGIKLNWDHAGILPNPISWRREKNQKTHPKPHSHRAVELGELEFPFFSASTPGSGIGDLERSRKNPKSLHIVKPPLSNPWGPPVGTIPAVH